MAHFAELDSNNKVLRVIVVANEDILDSNGNESEAVANTFLSSIGLAGNWKQTSYNNNFRGRYAGIGFTYDATKDEFIEPSES